MSKHSYLKILRPCDVDTNGVKYWKRMVLNTGKE